MKNKKTTIIGIIPLLSLVVSVVLVFLDKASLSEATTGIVATTALSQFLLGLNSKDDNVTHSQITNKTCSKTYKNV